MTRMIIAPTIAPMKPALSPGPYQPICWPSQVATNAPTMPRMVVRMKPRGSFLPGVMSLAMTPATKPMMMVQMMAQACRSRLPPANNERRGTRVPAATAAYYIRAELLEKPRPSITPASGQRKQVVRGGGRAGDRGARCEALER